MATRWDSDVLVIGGGGAGSMAALECHRRGLRTTMVVKGRLGKSGCSIFAGSLNFFDAPHDDEPKIEGYDGSANPDVQRVQRTLEFLGKYTHYLGDQEYMRRASEFARDRFYPWVEERGLYVLRDDQGVIVSDRPYRTQAWAPAMGLSGTTVMDLMRKLILREDIRMIEDATVTRLLTRDGQCVGATVYNIMNGDVYAVRAKVVILATGHSNYLSLRSTGTREGAGSGWVLAHNAGAELQNLEMQWYHTADVAYPSSWMRLHMYPNPLPDTRERSRLYNREGKVFFDSNWFATTPVPYIMQLKHLIKEVQAGRADLKGGYYSGYTHVEPEVMENYFGQTPFIKKLGLDPGEDLIENGITWHMNVGGVRANGLTMETCVPGLLVAGSVAGLVTGGLPNVMYDGTVAAGTAEEQVRSVDDVPELDAAQIEEEHERLRRYLPDGSDGSLLPGQVKKRIRSVMWKYMNYVKSEKVMERTLDELERIRRECLPVMRAGTESPRFNYDLVEAIDVEDMLVACELVTRFSLFRQESRGAYYREDHPYTDNVNWLVHVVGSRGPDDALQIKTIPVDLPYVEPERAILDFFEVDY